MKLFALLVITVLLLDLFGSSEAWWRRRRRRRRCSTPTTTRNRWVNHWDSAFTFKCPRGQAMTEVHSLFSSCYRDRVFRFACKRNPAASRRCYWSHYVNYFLRPVSFKCHSSGFITGIKSYHDNRYQDRRFMFRCCHHHRYHRYHCSTGSHFVNGWRQTINFRTPWKHFLVGVTSYHNNALEDRRWKFEYCKVVRNTHGWWRARKSKKN